MDTADISTGKDDLETALGAAAEAGEQEDTGDDIAAADAGASKLALEIDRENKPPASRSAGESDD